MLLRKMVHVWLVTLKYKPVFHNAYQHALCSALCFKLLTGDAGWGTHVWHTPSNPCVACMAS